MTEEIGKIAIKPNDDSSSKSSEKLSGFEQQMLGKSEHYEQLSAFEKQMLGGKGTKTLADYDKVEEMSEDLDRLDKRNVQKTTTKPEDDFAQLAKIEKVVAPFVVEPEDKTKTSKISPTTVQPAAATKETIDDDFAQLAKIEEKIASLVVTTQSSQSTDDAQNSQSTTPDTSSLEVSHLKRNN